MVSESAGQPQDRPNPKSPTRAMNGPGGIRIDGIIDLPQGGVDLLVQGEEALAESRLLSKRQRSRTGPRADPLLFPTKIGVWGGESSFASHPMNSGIWWPFECLPNYATLSTQALAYPHLPRHSTLVYMGQTETAIPLHLVELELTYGQRGLKHNNSLSTHGN